MYEEDDGSVHELIKDLDKTSKEETEKPERAATGDGVDNNESSADDG